MPVGLSHTHNTAGTTHHSGPSSPATTGHQQRCCPKHPLRFACPAAQQAPTDTLKRRDRFFSPSQQGYRDTILLQLKDMMVEASSFGPRALCNTIYHRFISSPHRKEVKQPSPFSFEFALSQQSTSKQQPHCPSTRKGQGTVLPDGGRSYMGPV